MKSPSIHQTPLYRAKAAYANMKRRCGNASGLDPTYAGVELRMTLGEWLEWAIPRYQAFIQQHPNETPNVSRKGDIGHYELSNLDIITKSSNRYKQGGYQDRVEAGLKFCYSCQQVKSISDFSKSRNRYDGLNGTCKPCSAIASRAYRRKSE